MASSGSASKETKAKFGSVLATYQGLLEIYQNEAVLKQPWGERLPISDLEAKTVKTISKNITSNPATGSSETQHYPVISKHHGSTLIEHSKELDSIFKELGFAAAASDTIPNDEATEGDLKGLLETRGQDEAIDNLPSEQEADG